MSSRRAGRRVGAAAFALSAAGFAGVTLAAPTIETTPPASAAGEVARIQSFQADMVLNSDGTLYLDETLAVEFPVPRRGIFRIFDTEDRGVDHPVEALAVTRDGVSEPWVWNDSASGTVTARIGVEDVWLDPGTYTYRLVSTTRNAIEPRVKGGETDPDAVWFWWDVVGSGWQMPIGSADVRVALPAEPLSVECVIGESTPCEPTVEGTDLSLSTGPLSPFEPVTLRVALPADEVAPLPAGEPVVPAAAAGLLGVALGGAGIALTRERRPGFPVWFEPPAGVRPAVGVRVLDERASDAELQATLFDLGERGVLRIEGQQEGQDRDAAQWRVHLVADPATAAIDPWEREVLAKLGLGGQGESFLVSRTVTAGERITRATEAAASGVRTAAAAYLVGSKVGGLFRLLAWLAWLALGVTAGFHLFGGFDPPMAVVVGVGAFAVVASVLAADGGRSTTRNEAGRDVWSRTGGFARFLTTESSDSRFDAAAHMDWFPRYLPWAVALGVGEEWARRYRVQGVAEPEVPYLVGWWGYGATTGERSSFADFDDSFSGAISSASATYAASQSSSSSGGGGGFSGGSGGGGGGGGSW